MECPKCKHKFEIDICQCKGLTIFDIYLSMLPKSHGRNKCRKCGKLLSEEKAEFVLNNPI